MDSVSDEIRQNQTRSNIRYGIIDRPETIKGKKKKLFRQLDPDRAVGMNTTKRVTHDHKNDATDVSAVRVSTTNEKKYTAAAIFSPKDAATKHDADVSAVSTTHDQMYTAASTLSHKDATTSSFLLTASHASYVPCIYINVYINTRT